MAARAVIRRLANPHQTLYLPRQCFLSKSRVTLNNVRHISGHFWQDLRSDKSLKNLCTGVGFASGALFASVIASPSAGAGRSFFGTASAQSSNAATNETSERFLSRDQAAGLELTLYQYQVCPFCCKLRAFLDYYDYPYEVVEVDPIRRKEVKFSEYRKVPILVHGGSTTSSSPDDAQLKTQLNDSSLIISALTTYMSTEEKNLKTIVSYFPQIEARDAKEKVSIEFANKYEIMLGRPGRTECEKEEKHWREWVDSVLVHYIPPNIYRRPSESVQAFSYIANHGKYNAIEKFIIKYAGAFGMFFVAKKLKKKYNIPDDVRSCLYGAAKDWTSAVGDRKFMGGGRPNLADLAVYGVLRSIEGLDAFNDMLDHTDIGPWYYRTQKTVNAKAGAVNINKLSQ